MSFEDDVERSISLYEKANARAAARTRQLIAQRGAKEALSYLVKSADLQQGFKVLRDNDQLDDTFEAVIIRHRHVFDDDPDAIAAAQWRLDHPHDLL